MNLNLKKKKSNPVEDMVRVLAESNDCLSELLHILKSHIEDCTCVSVIDMEKSVVASTEDINDDIKAMARSVGNFAKAYCLRYEKNGLHFRSGVDCIRIVPLAYRDRNDFCMLVEQTKNSPFRLDRCINLIAVAAAIDKVEAVAKDNLYSDALTGLPNRSAFISFAEKMAKEEENVYLGLLEVNKSGYKTFKALCDATSHVYDTLVKICGNNVFLLSEHVVGTVVFGEEEAFSCTSKLQDAIDALIPEHIDLMGVATKLEQDVYRDLYLCEHALTGTHDKTGAVLFLRFKEYEPEKEMEAYYNADAAANGVPESAVKEDTHKKAVEADTEDTSDGEVYETGAFDFFTRGEVHEES